MTFISYVRDLEKENQRRELHYIDYARSLEKKRPNRANRKPSVYVVERSIQNGTWEPYLAVRSREQALALINSCTDSETRYRCSALGLETKR